MNINILTGIQKFLGFINDNWVMIASVITAGVVIFKKAKTYLNLSNEEKIEIAKAQIKEVMLTLVTQAECDYFEWKNAGSIKRSQVIDEIFAMYPILSCVTNQEEIISWIDDMIDVALEKMREVFEQNKEVCFQSE